MATILDKLSPQAELGERLGGSLSSGLRSLVDSKLARIQRQTGLSALVDPKQAEALSYLPEEMVQKLMPQLMKNQQMQQGLAAFSPQGIQQPGDGQLDQLAPSQQPTSQEFQPSMVNQGFTPGQQLEQQVRQQSGQPLMQQPQLAPQGLPQGQQPAAPSQGLSKSQRIAQEDAAALEAGKKAFVLSNGNTAVALRAQQDAKKTMQRERVAEAKETSELSKIKEARVTSGLTESRKKAAELNDAVQARTESIASYKNVKDLIDTGAVDLGVIYQAKSLAGLETSGASPETQLAAKLLAAEPLRSLKGIPGQAARLSKVFDQLQAINGTLKNTPEGLKLIADSKMVEARAANLIDRAEVNAREKLRKAGKDVPLNLRDKITKDPAIKQKLAKYNSFITKRISSSVVDREPEAKLSNFKENQSILLNGTQEVYKKTKTPIGFAWVPVSGAEKTKVINESKNK